MDKNIQIRKQFANLLKEVKKERELTLGATWDLDPLVIHKDDLSELIHLDAEAFCSCGASKTFGESCTSRMHSHWCTRSVND